MDKDLKKKREKRVVCFCFIRLLRDPLWPSTSQLWNENVSYPLSYRSLKENIVHNACLR